MAPTLTSIRAEPSATVLGSLESAEVRVTNGPIKAEGRNLTREGCDRLAAAVFSRRLPDLRLTDFEINARAHVTSRPEAWHDERAAVGRGDDGPDDRGISVPLSMASKRADQPEWARGRHPRSAARRRRNNPRHRDGGEVVLPRFGIPYPIRPRT